MPTVLSVFASIVFAAALGACAGTPADLPAASPKAAEAPEPPLAAQNADIPPAEDSAGPAVRETQTVPEDFSFEGLGRYFIFSVRKPVLRWKDIPENARIRIQISDEENFAAPRLLVDQTAEGSFFLLPVELDPEKIYHLRGMRLSGDGGAAKWTDGLRISYRPFPFPVSLLSIPRKKEGSAFTMGYSKGLSRETPEHQVLLSRDYSLGKFEITNAQLAEVMNRLIETGSAELRENRIFGLQGLVYLGLGELNYGVQFGLRYEKDRIRILPGRENHPAAGVSFYGALVFCNTLSRMEGLEPVYDERGSANYDAGGYRLPTEAEWEFAARGSTGALFPTGSVLEPRSCNYYRSGDPFEVLYGDPTLRGGPTTAVGYYDGSLRGGYRTVNGAISPGLADMLGDVWEWCGDIFDQDYYRTSPKDDPAGAESGEYRSLRGGAWNTPGAEIRFTARGWYRPEDMSYSIGFRVARSGPSSAATLSK